MLNSSVFNNCKIQKFDKHYLLVFACNTEIFTDGFSKTIDKETSKEVVFFLSFLLLRIEKEKAL